MSVTATRTARTQRGSGYVVLAFVAVVVASLAGPLVSVPVAVVLALTLLRGYRTARVLIVVVALVLPLAAYTIAAGSVSGGSYVSPPAVAP